MCQTAFYEGEQMVCLLLIINHEPCFRPFLRRFTGCRSSSDLVHAAGSTPNCLPARLELAPEMITLTTWLPTRSAWQWKCLNPCIYFSLLFLIVVFLTIVIFAGMCNLIFWVFTSLKWILVSKRLTRFSLPLSIPLKLI